MNLNNPLISTAVLVLATMFGFGQDALQTKPAPAATAFGDLRHGVVVETVDKSFEAEKAGLQQGDLILNWSRGGEKGEIGSPFDLSQVNLEQSPRGNVTLTGFRGAVQHNWILGPADWGLKVRPNFAGPALAAYLHGQELANAGKPTEAAQSWRALAEMADASQPVWLRSWLFFHSAQVLIGIRQWKEADDAFREAAERSPGIEQAIRSQVFGIWAESFFLRADASEAEKYAQQALTESRKLGRETLIQAKNLDRVGMVIGMDQREAYYREALAIQEKLAPGSRDIAWSLVLLGAVFLDRGDLSRAEDCERQALDIVNRIAPDGFEAASSLTTLGLTAWKSGDLAKAEDYYRQGLALVKKFFPDAFRIAALLNNLGNVANDRGNLESAEQYFNEAWAILHPDHPERRQFHPDLQA